MIEQHIRQLILVFRFQQVFDSALRERRKSIIDRGVDGEWSWTCQRFGEACGRHGGDQCREPIVTGSNVDDAFSLR